MFFEFKLTSGTKTLESKTTDKGSPTVIISNFPGREEIEEEGKAQITYNGNVQPLSYIHLEFPNSFTDICDNKDTGLIKVNVKMRIVFHHPPNS